jgi:hypothetical protein
MKVKLLGLTLAAAAIFSPGASAQDHELKTLKAVAILSKSIEASDLAVMLEDSGLKPLLFESDFKAGRRAFHDFYLNSAKVPAGEIGTDYANEREAFLHDMLAVDPDATLFSAEIRELQEDMITALRDNARNPILVNKITFEGSIESVRLLRKNPEKLFTRVEILSEGRNRQRVEEERETPPALLKATAVTWYPNSGSSVTGNSGTSERYVTQFMKWNQPSFSSIGTYEHDFFLYNYNNDGTYLSSARTAWPDCMPKISYASTSWSAATKPYLDTRYWWTGCEKDEMAFTIGAAQADAITKGVLHNTYIRTAKGNVDKDKFKVQAQRGYRDPTNCYTTWCSFGDSIVNLISAWSDKAPGTVNWTKQ